MKILKTYKFRLRPDENTLSILKQHGGNSRFLWNQLVNFSKDYNKKHHKFPTQSELQKEIIKIKGDNEFLKLSHSQPLQINAQRLAKTNFNSIKPQTIKERKIKIAQAKTKKQKAKALNFGKPKFKSKHNENDSIFYPQNFKIKKSRIFVSKIGWIPFIKHRNIMGKPLNLTITQDEEQWYCSISCELKIKEEFKKDIDNANVVGIDVGIKEFATLSDNTKVHNPKHLKKYLKKLKKEQRKLSRKQDNSNNKIKQKNKVRKIHRKVKNTRKDFLHKLTHDMINKYDGFVLETLSINNMLSSKNKNNKNNKKDKGDKNLHRSIQDASWYEFGRQLEYKSFWYSKYFIRTNSFSPTTKKCSQCNNVIEMKLSDRTYDCPKCGNHIDRDYNASLNIVDEGIKKMKKIRNTLATKEIYACGQSTLADWLMQEKSLICPNGA